MSLKLYRPTPEGLEPSPVQHEDWRPACGSRRWSPAPLANPEMAETSPLMGVLFFVGLAILTFALIVMGYAHRLLGLTPKAVRGRARGHPRLYSSVRCVTSCPASSERNESPPCAACARSSTRSTTSRPHYEALTDEEIRARDGQLARRDPSRRGAHRAVRRGAEAGPRAPRATCAGPARRTDLKHLQDALDDALPEVFAAAREVSRRKLGMRPFDVQLMGGIVLHQGKIAEMKTGEGKTLVAPLAAALNAMSGRGVHVVTVNDYLAKRDPQWMGPIFHGLGLTVGIIQHDSAFLFDPDYRPTRRAAASTCARSRARRPTPRTSPTARTTSSASTTCATTWSRSSPSGCSASATSRSSTRSTTSSSTRRARRSSSAARPRSRRTSTTSSRASCRGSRRAPEGAEEGGDYFVDLKEHAVSPTEEGIDKIERLLGVRRTSTTSPTRAWRATSSRRCGRTRSTSATATTSSRTARSSSSTSSPVARCPAGAGRRASTRRSRPRRACASSASR